LIWLWTMASKLFAEAKHSSYARVGVTGENCGAVESGWLADDAAGLEDVPPYESNFNLDAPIPDVATRVPLVVPPKVFADLKSVPGEAPRSLLVERKRREYEDKLAQLPSLILEHAKPGTLGSDSLLQVEHFDDEEYDIRSPVEWIKLGSEGSPSGQCRLPAVALCRKLYPKEKSELESFEDVVVCVTLCLLTNLKSFVKSFAVQWAITSSSSSFPSMSQYSRSQPLTLRHTILQWCANSPHQSQRPKRTETMRSDTGSCLEKQCTCTACSCASRWRTLPCSLLACARRTPPATAQSSPSAASSTSTACPPTACGL
jgi:hypothetical protein